MLAVVVFENCKDGFYLRRSSCMFSQSKAKTFFGDRNFQNAPPKVGEVEDNFRHGSGGSVMKR